jgi:peptide deformylase
MTARNVITNPNNVLRVKSEFVELDEIASSEIKTLIQDLKETMVIENGIGIAAPQIGVHKQIILVTAGETAQALINPKIVKRSFRKIITEEGCLSVPGVFGLVKRNRLVKVEAFDENGEEITVSAEGLSSVVIQHEIDHLNGVLFIDKVRKYTQPPKM